MSESDVATVTVSVFYGPVINPKDLNTYEILPQALIAVDPNGTIIWTERDVKPGNLQDYIKERLPEVPAPDGYEISVSLIELDDGEFIIPGFIDTHTHAPQMPNIGSGQQYELLDWLEHVTFPMEARFKDIDFAKKIYPEVVRRFINFGTTTCCYYGTLHLEATKVLADVVTSLGQRALVGKCNMNRNSPEYYCEASTEKSLEDTRKLISYIRSLKTSLVSPVLTPRFAISCTGDLLEGIGKIAEQDKTLAIQTHISENAGEIKFTKELFPDCDTYASVYAKYGLLRERTILAHGVHLEESELKMIKELGAGISHCPTSNFNLRSGMAKVGDMLDRGIKVGLGTDVSGGFSPSMLNAIQNASICSKMVALQSAIEPTNLSFSKSNFSGKQLSIATLLYLATLGGASLCCMEDKIGSFAVRKSFDALIVSVRAETENPSIWSATDGDTKNCQGHDIEKRLDAQLERFLFGGDDRNILKVYVQGKCIGGKAYKPKIDLQTAVISSTN